MSYIQSDFTIPPHLTELRKEIVFYLPAHLYNAGGIGGALQKGIESLVKNSDDPYIVNHRSLVELDELAILLRHRRCTTEITVTLDADEVEIIGDYLGRDSRATASGTIAQQASLRMVDTKIRESLGGNSSAPITLSVQTWDNVKTGMKLYRLNLTLLIEGKEPSLAQEQRCKAILDKIADQYAINSIGHFDNLIKEIEETQQWYSDAQSQLMKMLRTKITTITDEMTGFLGINSDGGTND